MADSTDFKAILSLKIKRLRKGRGLTLANLAKASGLSVSYLSQLEAGQKYPTPPRMAELASALGCSYEDLTSTKLEQDDRMLHGFLSSPTIKEFPFEYFGILSSDVTRLLTRSPTEMAALLKAIGDLAREFDIDNEHFFDVVLRAYQESTGNYYPAIEQQAEQFARRLARSGHRPDVPGLRYWLTANGVRQIDDRILRDHPVLGRCASVFVPRSQRLLLNPQLSEPYQLFLLARETGYRVLGLQERTHLEPRRKATSFDHIRDDFHATYFAEALLMPRVRLVADLRAWFRMTRWQPKTLVELIDKYGVLPERLMHRLNRIVSSQLGIGGIFRQFRLAEGSESFQQVKSIDLQPTRTPAGANRGEHYCMRWLLVRLLLNFRRQHAVRQRRAPLVGAQFTELVQTGQRYFALGLAAPDSLERGVVNAFGFGFNADAKLLNTIQFANDPSIPSELTGMTCERCPLSADACTERVAPPLIRDRALAVAEEDRAIMMLDQSGPSDHQ